MKVDNTKYFTIALCKIGMLFIALGTIRSLAIHGDQLSFLLGLGGYLLVSMHVGALEKRWAIPKKHTLISGGLLAVAFLLLAYWLAFPG